MLLFNLIITLICLWIILKVNHLFIQPAIWNKHRFMLFELRDNLAILCMKGQISEKSTEYLTLMSLLNKAVKETDKFQTVNFLRFLHAIKRNKNLQHKMDQIIQELNSESKEYKQILHGYFKVIHKMFIAQTKSFYWIAPPVIFILGCCHILTKTVSLLRDRLEILKLLDVDIQEKREKSLCHAHG